MQKNYTLSWIDQLKRLEQQALKMGLLTLAAMLRDLAARYEVRS